MQDKRQKRTRLKLKKNTKRVRLTVFRSNKYISGQIIDEKGKTLMTVTEKQLVSKGTKTQKANELGKALAKQAIAKKIKDVIFDRGSYAYHGRVRAFAQGAREGGLNF